MEFRDVRISLVKEILLAEVAKFRAHLRGNFGIIIDHERHAASDRDLGQSFRNPANILWIEIFGAKLHQIRPTVTKSSTGILGIPAVQICRIYKRIKQALFQRLQKLWSPLSLTITLPIRPRITSRTGNTPAGYSTAAPPHETPNLSHSCGGSCRAIASATPATVASPAPTVL